LLRELGAADGELELLAVHLLVGIEELGTEPNGEELQVRAGFNETMVDARRE
jgi:hypothetical protein